MSDLPKIIDDLVKKYQDIPKIVVNKYYKTYHDKSELLSIGYETLFICATKVDESKLDQFPAYVIKSIIGKIENYRLKYEKKANRLKSKLIEEKTHCFFETYDLINKNAFKIKNYEIINLLRQGYSQKDISEKLSITEQKVSRQLKKLKKNQKLCIYIQDIWSDSNVRDFQIRKTKPKRPNC